MLLVASVYYGNNREMNNFWLKLQEDFLKRTTKNYHHVVFLNDIDYKEDFEHLKIIGEGIREKDQKGSLNHMAGLHKIIEYCQEHTEYDHLLILDSDAFPVDANWQKILFEKLDVNDLNLASVVRCEKLDIFPHPSAMLLNRKGINEAKIISVCDLDFEKAYVSPIFNKKMLEEEENTDPTLDMPFFPMVRSNFCNDSQYLAGIYYDLFFHMGASSRRKKIRITTEDCARVYVSDEFSFILKRLKNGPVQYMNYLVNGCKKIGV